MVQFQYTDFYTINRTIKIKLKTICIIIFLIIQPPNTTTMSLNIRESLLQRFTDFWSTNIYTPKTAFPKWKKSLGICTNIEELHDSSMNFGERVLYKIHPEKEQYYLLERIQGITANDLFKMGMFDKFTSKGWGIVFISQYDGVVFEDLGAFYHCYTKAIYNACIRWSGWSPLKFTAYTKTFLYDEKLRDYQNYMMILYEKQSNDYYENDELFCIYGNDIMKRRQFEQIVCDIINVQPNDLVEYRCKVNTGVSKKFERTTRSLYAFQIMLMICVYISIIVFLERNRHSNIN